MKNELINILRPLVARSSPVARACKPKGKDPYCENKPLDDDALSHHLNGGPAYGIYPIKPGRNTTEVACLDFDSHRGEATWDEMRTTAQAVSEALEADGHHPQPFRSSGGKGIHVILLWAKPQDAWSVRVYLRSVLAKHGLSDGDGGVKQKQAEVFPKQNMVKEGSYGNMFVLPLAFESAPLDPFDFEPLPKEEARHIRWRSSKDVPFVEKKQRERKHIELTEADHLMLRSALDAIPNDGEGIHYNEWRNVVFALHHATLGSEDGFQLATDFSERSSKHNQDFFESRVWPHIKIDHESENGPITINSLFAYARTFGWHEPPGMDFEPWLNDLEDRIEEALTDEDGEEYPEPFDLWKGERAAAWRKGMTPDVLHDFAIDRAEIASHDPKGYGAMAVAAAAAAVPLHVQVQPKRNDPHWQTPCITWALIAGESGEGKTPMISSAFKPIEDHNRRLMELHRLALSGWEAECDATKRGETKPPKPKMKRRMVQDVTIEMLGHIMADDCTGIVYVADELIGFLNAIGQYKAGKNSERAIWLSAFNGKPYAIDRVNRGSIYVERWGPSISGGIQPSRLEEAAADAIQDGMLPRFTMAKLQEADRISGPGNPGAVHAYKVVVEKLLSLPAMTLRFSQEAQKIYDEVVTNSGFLSKGLLDSQPGVAYHLQKAGFIVARLAAVFHLTRWAAEEEEGDFINDQPEAEISADTAAMAADYFNWNINQQFSTYIEMGQVSAGVFLARQLAGFILAHKKAKPSKRDFARGIPAWRKAANLEQRAAIQVLYDYGWLVKDVSRRGKGREGVAFSQGTHWETNPKVFSVFERKAEEERERREEVCRRIAETAKRIRASRVSDIDDTQE